MPGAPRGLCRAPEQEMFAGKREMLSARMLGVPAGTQVLKVSVGIPKKSGWRRAARGLPAGRRLGRAGGRTGDCSDLRRSPRAAEHPRHIPICPRQGARWPHDAVPEHHAWHPSPSPRSRPHPGGAAVLPALEFPFTEGGAEKNASIIEPGRREPDTSPLLMPLR